MDVDLFEFSIYWFIYVFIATHSTSTSSAVFLCLCGGCWPFLHELFVPLIWIACHVAHLNFIRIFIMHTYCRHYILWLAISLAQPAPFRNAALNKNMVFVTHFFNMRFVQQLLVVASNRIMCIKTFIHRKNVGLFAMFGLWYWLQWRCNSEPSVPAKNMKTPVVYLIWSLYHECVWMCTWKRSTSSILVWIHTFNQQPIAIRAQFNSVIAINIISRTLSSFVKSFNYSLNH